MAWFRGARPLFGVRVLELQGLAPGPYCGFLLADFGADVVRVDGGGLLAPPVLCHGKRGIHLNLKDAQHVATLKQLLGHCDVMIDPFRPGVLERLGLCPAKLIETVNPRLIVARITGYGQTGPMKLWPGHDINYISMAGSLAQMGPHQSVGPPEPPLNLLADFAGGGLMAFNGVLLALLERERSGRGQVIDVSMTEGAAYVSTFVHDMRRIGQWPMPRGENLLDGGAPFYRVYATSDARYMAVGCIEPRFYQCFLEVLGANDTEKHVAIADLPEQLDQAGWPLLQAQFERIFKLHTLKYWAEKFEAVPDACVTPVLEWDEIETHPLTAPLNLSVDSLPRPAPRLDSMSEFPSRQEFESVDLANLLREWAVPPKIPASM